METKSQYRMEIKNFLKNQHRMETKSQHRMEHGYKAPTIPFCAGFSFPFCAGFFGPILCQILRACTGGWPLTWRLRPLGHLAFNKSQQEYESGNVFQTVIEENNKGRNGEKGKFSYADSNRGREIQSLEC